MEKCDVRVSHKSGKTLFRISILFVFLFALTHFGVAQKAAPKAAADPSSIAGGVGMTWIDGEPYYLISLQPELAFGKFGVGLDLNLRFSSKTQQLRSQDFNETYDYIRIIRYLRWGHKGDDIYARVGVLDYAKLGHGSIMYLYQNSPVYDERRIGTEFDMNFSKFGFETVYSDVAAAGIFGLRGYVKPLQYTTLASTPILGGLEVGVSWAGDFRSNSADTSYVVSSGVRSQKNDGSMNILGADLGFPLLRLPTISSTLYFDYAKILNYGSGEALGLETDFNAFGILKIFTKFERRWSGDQFVFNYFDSFYELERYALTPTTFSSKALELKNTLSPGPGYFGDITFDFLGFLKIRGAYQRLDNIDTSGTLHLGTSLGEKIPLIIVDAGYDKKYIRDNADVFTLDNRSLLYVNIGYKPYPFMIVSTLYTWTFKKNETTGAYESEKRVTPKVSFVFPL